MVIYLNGILAHHQITISDHSPLQVTKTICDALWGNQLSFHPFNRGDAPVEFTSLWPTKAATLVETYAHANIEQAPYELCKLLVTTNSAQSLDALLEERVRPCQYCCTSETSFCIIFYMVELFPQSDCEEFLFFGELRSPQAHVLLLHLGY